MSHTIGLDVGGTKIAAGIFAEDGRLLANQVSPLSGDYHQFLSQCGEMVRRLETQIEVRDSKIGIGVAGRIDFNAGTVVSHNIPFLEGRVLRHDLSGVFGRDVLLENDANCAALAEAREGAGKDCDLVMGLIIGTGIGGAFVKGGQIIRGANGTAGEIGHLPLPFRETADGPLTPCGCGQKGCIDKAASGNGLARLYTFMTGREADAKSIDEMARAGDSEALRVLDCYYEVLAKAMVAVLHAFDPDIIVVSGGMNGLLGLYEEVPKRWGRYALVRDPKTKFVPALHGAMAGVRGAAMLCS